MCGGGGTLASIGRTVAAPFKQTAASVAKIATAPGKATLGQFLNVGSAGVIAPKVKDAGAYYRGVVTDVGLVAGGVAAYGALTAPAAAPLATASTTVLGSGGSVGSTAFAAPSAFTYAGAPSIGSTGAGSIFGASSLDLAAPVIGTGQITASAGPGILGSVWNGLGSAVSGAGSIIKGVAGVAETGGLIGLATGLIRGVGQVAGTILEVPAAILGGQSGISALGGIAKDIGSFLNPSALSVGKDNSQYPGISPIGPTITSFPGNPNFAPGQGPAGGGLDTGNSAQGQVASPILAGISPFIMIGLAGAALFILTKKK